ncbi:hypothetical protein, partial [Peribacillus simplex]|uniref:hypothetical protein n=1 Tax=Peribacillus simplex TaxID=1478 RepID=UPI0019D58A8A
VIYNDNIIIINNNKTSYNILSRKKQVKNPNSNVIITDNDNKILLLRSGIYEIALWMERIERY